MRLAAGNPLAWRPLSRCAQLPPASPLSVSPTTATAAAASTKRGYARDAPWPGMRGDMRNSGCRLDRGPVPRTTLPIRVLRTGNAVFSTPILGRDEVIFVGSADKTFYAYDPIRDTTLWTLQTQECIDSAACLGANGQLFVPSCDASIYRVEAQSGRLLGRFDALKEPVGYTPSTIFWWEGNLVFGPQGLLYGGNDNFYLYAFHPDGALAWAQPAGLNIWSAPAFDDEGRIFCASFDTNVCARDALSGKPLWERSTGNLVAASPCVVGNKVIVGNLGGVVTALDRRSGKCLWTARTGAHIYASAAVAPDGKVFVGSGDGSLYAFAAADGRLLWAYRTGDALRSSAAVGPDPEGLVPYLVYVGGGNGLLYALTPDGLCRWSFDTAQLSPGAHYRNINASIALGSIGLCAATANGEVLWLPYDAYLRLPGFVPQPAQPPAKSVALQWLNAGGVPQSDGLVRASFGQPMLCLRRVVALDAPTLRQQDVTVHLEPPLPHRLYVSPNGEHIGVELLQQPPIGRTCHMALTLAARANLPASQVETAFCAPAIAAALPLAALPQVPLRMSHMSLFEPAIVPSFDQVGLASLALDIQVVDFDARSGNVAAWGVLQFGTDASGKAVGVPHGRSSLFAFNGHYEGGHLTLEARKPWLEITATPVPLSRFKLSCAMPDATPQDGGSIVAEVRVPTIWAMVKGLLRGQVPALMRMVDVLRGGTKTQARSTRDSRRHRSEVLARTCKLGWRIATSGMYRAWQLLDDDNRFVGLGCCRMSQRQPDVNVQAAEVHFDATRGEVQGSFVTPQQTLVAAIALIDRQTHRLVALDYNTLCTSTQQSATVRTHVVLRTSGLSPCPAGSHEALLLAGTRVVGRCLI